jgi:hypothetical protein
LADEGKRDCYYCKKYFEDRSVGLFGDCDEGHEEMDPDNCEDYDEVANRRYTD